MMEKQLIINKKVLFGTGKAKIWELLTSPEMTKQYMFGCEVLSDWELGSAITWKSKNEKGIYTTLVKGEIKEIEPKNKVSFTMFDPNIGMADIPENYVMLTYEITETDNGTALTILQDFSGTENAQKRYDESLQGWDMVIGLMKKFIE